MSASYSGCPAHCFRLGIGSCQLTANSSCPAIARNPCSAENDLGFCIDKSLTPQTGPERNWRDIARVADELRDRRVGGKAVFRVEPSGPPPPAYRPSSRPGVIDDMQNPSRNNDHAPHRPKRDQRGCSTCRTNPANSRHRAPRAQRLITPAPPISCCRARKCSGCGTIVRKHISGLHRRGVSTAVHSAWPVGGARAGSFTPRWLAEGRHGCGWRSWHVLSPASAANRCRMNGSTSAPNSATINCTRWTIRPEMK